MLGTALRRRALYAVDSRAEERASAVFSEHPRSHLPGRIVTHVLSVAAVEVGNPEAALVLVKTDDGAHTAQFKDATRRRSVFTCSQSWLYSSRELLSMSPKLESFR